MTHNKPIVCVCVCMCVCVRACVRECLRACVRSPFISTYYQQIMVFQLRRLCLRILLHVNIHTALHGQYKTQCHTSNLCLGGCVEVLKVQQRDNGRTTVSTLEWQLTPTQRRHQSYTFIHCQCITKFYGAYKSFFFFKTG